MDSIRLPRSKGFFVRWRARSGLLPGQVSTAALVSARRLRWASTLGLVPMVLVTVALLAVSSSTEETTDESVTAVASFGEAELPSNSYPYRIVLEDGGVLDFDDDPQVAAGDEVVVRRGSDGDATGIVLDGDLLQAQPDYDDTGGLVVMAIFFAIFLIVSAPMLVWSWRTFGQIRSDLHSPVDASTGVYQGSWQWRGLTNRLGRVGPAGALAHHLSGIPVAVEIDGELKWFAAPAVAVSELVDFEAAIKGGDRAVTVTYHPESKAIARMQGSGADVDFETSIDAMNPETGLSLKVSRRRRLSHLPDF